MADQLRFPDPAFAPPPPRPIGTDADQWQLFLAEHRAALPFLAVQIAEALEFAERRGFERGVKDYAPASLCPICDRPVTDNNCNIATGCGCPPHKDSPEHHRIEARKRELRHIALR